MRNVRVHAATGAIAVSLCMLMMGLVFSTGSASAATSSPSPSTSPTTSPSAGPTINPSPLPPPTGLHVTGTTVSTVSLAWNPVGGAASYGIFRGSDNLLSYLTSVTGTSFTDTGLLPGTTYEYSVVSQGPGGANGAPGDDVTVTTATYPPCASAWDIGLSYAPGDVVSSEGHNWTSIWYSTGAPPASPISWAVWQDDGACS